ncbi:Crp/Fnr family transcriptional regulator [Psychromonas hadalis]|uniref:Crp/Fnr family transcriptional regulator n=1 Tax=Psychromonas hadalis TaxID=211669 RepID=UPI0003B3CEA9|nr:Crp/Fnr family transcriptional regulator [Psychromonas hadalis]
MSNSIISLLNEAQKKVLIAAGKTETFKAGHTLFFQGDDAKEMYLVKKGKISLFRLMPNGDEKLFGVFIAGDLIAEMAMFMTPRKYPMTAKVEQETVLSVFGDETITGIIMDSPELSIKVITYMSNKIAKLMDTLNILTQVNANQRLIMKLAEIYNDQPQHEGKIHLTVTKKLLATQLGMTPETLSRVFKKLKDSGFLQESGNYITILNISLLCKSVDLAPDLFACQTNCKRI